MRFGAAISSLIACGLDAEVESIGREVFVKTEDYRGRLVFLKITAGNVNGAEARKLIADKTSADARI